MCAGSGNSDDNRTAITFSIQEFVPLLAERIHVVNSFTRSFNIRWLLCLDSLPQLEIITYLADFFDGLLNYVSDTNADVRVGAVNLIGEFLKEIKGIYKRQLSRDEENGNTKHVLGNAVHVDYVRLIQILLAHARAIDCEETRAIALEWLYEFTKFAPAHVVSIMSDLISVVLQCLSSSNSGICRTAENCNAELRNLLLSDTESPNRKADLSKLALVLMTTFECEYEASRFASLQWLILLHKLLPNEVCINCNSNLTELVYEFR